MIGHYDEYIQDLEEECENLSEYNRLLIKRIKELEKEMERMNNFNGIRRIKRMVYQFEHGEIKKCIWCPMWVFPETETIPLCSLTGETILKGSTPQENNCPLVAIPKTETTGANENLLEE